MTYSSVCRATCWLGLVLHAGASEPWDSLRPAIERELRDSNVASVAVGVARNGRIEWEEAFGWADTEARVAATPRTPYSLASISKPITATALMKLVSEGRVNLDAPANRYLADAPIRARTGDPGKATVRRIASHAAGLPLHYQFFYMNEAPRPPAHAETMRRFAWLVFPPGRQYQYSNLGYGILDWIIAQASGRLYEDYLRDEILRPLGMNDSYAGPHPEEGRPYARRYDANGRTLPFYDFDHRGGSAIWASVHDLLRFALFHLNLPLADQTRPLPEALVRQMQKPVTRIRPGSGYGIGWNIRKTRGGYRVVSHNGSMPGVATTLRMIPERKLAVVALANGGAPLPHRVADMICEKLLPDWERDATPEDPPAPFRPPSRLRGRWTGEIETYTRGVPVEIEVNGSHMTVRLAGDDPKAVNESRWHAKRLSGQWSADPGIEETRGRPSTLRFSLAMNGASLEGPVSVLSMPSSGMPPAGAVTLWMRLRRAP
ncbi:MAG: beta-lactamase family protein [Bryobacterales bacterium]|nr:beta-lactamase family protein [Bryobacterales bacterium]